MSSVSISPVESRAIALTWQVLGPCLEFSAPLPHSRAQNNSSFSLHPVPFSALSLSDCWEQLISGIEPAREPEFLQSCGVFGQSNCPFVFLILVTLCETQAEWFWGSEGFQHFPAEQPSNLVGHLPFSDVWSQTGVD